MSCPLTGFYEAVETIIAVLGCSEESARMWINHNLDCIRKQGGRPTRVEAIGEFATIRVHYDKE